jgi:membrane fusion protein (multidrug efflux system)
MLLITACADDSSKPEQVVSGPPVLVVPVLISDVEDRIEATGQLIAKARATVAAQVEGAVTVTAVEEGDPVEQGQTLLEVDPRRRELELAREEAQVAEARAQLAEATREVSRIGRLSMQNAASQSRLDEANTRESLTRSRLSGAEARLGLARRALDDATVKAPFSGLIARRHVSVGEYLTVGLPLFDIVALDPIEVEFTLAEVDSARVQIGRPVQITVAPYPERPFAGTVTMISPTIDPRTRTLRVKAELSNAEGLLRPGLFARADLGVSVRKGVTMVPDEAIVQRANGPMLYRLVAGNRVESLPVETGVMREGWVEVSGGLVAGDRVVARGQADLVEGIVVSVRSEDGRVREDGWMGTPPPYASSLQLLSNGGG